MTWIVLFIYLICDKNVMAEHINPNKSMRSEPPRQMILNKPLFEPASGGFAKIFTLLSSGIL